GARPATQRTRSALHARQPAVGRCEVVCYTSDHNATLADLPPRRIRTVLEAWVDRTLALSSLPNGGQVFCLRNSGREIRGTGHLPVRTQRDRAGRLLPHRP